MKKTIKLKPRSSQPLIYDVEAVFLGQKPKNSHYTFTPPPTPVSIHHLVNQWLAVSCVCFVISLCLNFILNY